MPETLKTHIIRGCAFALPMRKRKVTWSWAFTLSSKESIDKWILGPDTPPPDSIFAIT